MQSAHVEVLLQSRQNKFVSSFMKLLKKYWYQKLCWKQKGDCGPSGFDA